MARMPSICPDCGGVEGASCWGDEACYRNQAANHLATLSEIRDILAEPVRDAVDRGFVMPEGTNLLRLPRRQWKRLHELLGGAE